MAYETGSVNSGTALKNVIEAFASNNGITSFYNGGSVSLSAATVVNSAVNYEEVYLSVTVDGGGNPQTPKIRIKSDLFPITYYCFTTTANQVVTVVNYNLDLFQWLAFGDIVKIHNSAYTGGMWNWASCKQGNTNTEFQGQAQISETSITNHFGYEWALPFVNSASGTSQSLRSINCLIDDETWPQADKVSFTDQTIALLYRSPNTWNQETELIPIHLQFAAKSNFYMYLGYIEDLRFVRIDNYGAGDIINLGGTKWKVFPVVKKNSTERNSPSGYYSYHSGTIGLAVRYDGA